MKLSNGVPLPHLPEAYWAYLGLTSIYVAVAAIPSGIKISVTVFGVLLGLTLLVGLAFGSVFCRFALILFSISSALGIMLLQTTFPNGRDIALVAISLIQVAILCTPAMRAYTARR
jgi:hypothetical protein